MHRLPCIFTNLQADLAKLYESEDCSPLKTVPSVHSLGFIVPENGYSTQKRCNLGFSQPPPVLRRNPRAASTCPAASKNPHVCEAQVQAPRKRIAGSAWFSMASHGRAKCSGEGQ